MTDPSPQAQCEFRGAARTARVVGTGVAQLAAPAAFQAPSVTAVDLVGARIGTEGPPVTVTSSQQFEPVQMNDAKDGYDVTYVAGPPARIVILAGGNDGWFRGNVGGPSCATTGCAVAWQAPAKSLVLHADASAGEVLLSGRFPFYFASQPAKRTSVSSVVITNAEGSLVCPDGPTVLHGDVEWRASPFGSLDVKPIVLASGRLRIVISTSPDAESRPHAAPTATTAASDGGAHESTDGGVSASSPPGPSTRPGTTPADPKLAWALGGGAVLAMLAVGAFVLRRHRTAPMDPREMRVLFLSANPTTRALDLEEEVRSIEDQLEAVRFRDRIRFVSKQGVRPDDLVRHVRRERPTVVHFSGHGSTEGIFLRDDAGGETLVRAERLRAFFEGRGVRLVVLNACFTQRQAERIALVVPMVIGTAKELDDEAARRFAKAFYRTLGDGHPVADAFRDGKDAVSLHSLDAAAFRSLGSLDGVLVQ